ncbi:MAG: O-methyltransferase [Clostridia bacterium]|nr:O-methyltransferase [Clostridia bacterium]
MNITNDKVTEYLHGLYTPLTTELGALRESAEKDNVPIILKETESFLNVYLRSLKPKAILEIGTAVGYSASFFKEVCKDAKVVTIEKFLDKAEVAKKNISDLGYDITVLTGDGEEVINDMADELFDFVFIDAAKSHYTRFLDAAMKHLSSDGVIVADNVLFKARTVSDEYDPSGKYKTNIKNLRSFIEYIMDHPKLDSAVLSVGDGLSISVLRSIDE